MLPDQNVPLTVDKADICDKLRIPQEIFERIVRNAFVPTDKDISDLLKAVDSDDFDTIHKIAHRLKGTYSNLRIPQLAQIAHQINDLSLQRKDKASIIQLLGQFKFYYEQLKKFF